MLQLELPGIWASLEACRAESFRPFHYEQRAHGLGLLVFLKEQIIGSLGDLQPVKIEMHQGWVALGVVLSQSKRGAGDRFLNAECQGQSLNKRGFAGTQLPLQQQHSASWELGGECLTEPVGGLQVLKDPGALCRLVIWRARSLGDSAEISVHVLPRELYNHGGNTHGNDRPAGRR